MLRKIRSALQTTALAVALPFSSVTAQQADEVTTPQVPEVKGRFTLVSANPKNQTAVIREAGRDFPYDCDRLAHAQQSIERDVISQSTTSIAFGNKHKQQQSLKLELSFGHTTLAEAYQYSADTIKNDEGGHFKWAAQLGHERNTFVQAQIDAGCHKPEGFTFTPIK